MNNNNISLKEYFDTRINALEKATTIVANNLKEATAIAASGIDKRLENMNDFRWQLKDQASTFLPRTEYAAQIERISTDVKMLRETKSALDVSAAMMEKRLESMNEFRSALKDQASTFMPRAEYDAQMKSVDTDLRVLRESKAELAGKSSQLATNIATAIAVIGLVISLVGFFRYNFTPISAGPAMPTAIIQSK